MSKKIKIKINQGWIAYPGSTVQQNYAEDLVHGYLSWNIKDRNQFTVNFRQLPNPKPFVTIEWAGDVQKTFDSAVSYPRGSRFRIKSHTHVAQQEIQELTSMLKQALNATEITFKVDQQFNRETISAGTQTLVHADLRNPDILFGLVKNYHASNVQSDDVWARVNEQVKAYLIATATEDSAPRNTKWSIRDLKFDNAFAYGEGNHINFDSLNGIVGIFGQNRAGKSSVVGNIMYSLFNTTDRGPIKNLHVINARKPYCYSRAIVNVGGTDYVFERQTVKHENARRGIVHAVTSLNAYRVTENGDVVDLAGEQRNDTEKVIRNLIGNPDDFLLTSLSAQGEINQFIQHGSSRRRQILSRFLDLDIFDRLYDLANKDVNTTKAQMRAYPEKDWNKVASDLKAKLQSLSDDIETKTQKIQEHSSRLAEARAALASHSDITPVSKSQVDAQRNKVISLERQVASTQAKITDLKIETGKIEGKLSTIDTLKQEYDIEELKKKLEAFNALETTVLSLKHLHEKEASVLKQQERSLKILDEVPCGNMFPTCKFIKDAHLVKDKVFTQRDKVSRALEKLDRASETLDSLKTENVRDKVEKMQKMHELQSKLKVELSNNQIVLVKLESQLDSLVSSLDASKSKLDELEEALKNEENAEVVSLRTEIDELLSAISKLDKDKMIAAVERGKLISDAEKALDEKKNREALLQKMKVHELVSSAFSRKGIPSAIVSSQLPIINAEISKILAGIVDFTVELEVDDESDWMDVYINYGDSRRIVELGSGMEKMISSIAIRVALINISSLPKTDMFIIDEGFGALDDAGVEACNRLLVSLKRYFKIVMIITHVDGVKDAADTVLEITKNEKDAKIVYE